MANSKTNENDRNIFTLPSVGFYDSNTNTAVPFKMMFTKTILCLKFMRSQMPEALRLKMLLGLSKYDNYISLSRITTHSLENLTFR